MAEQDNELLRWAAETVLGWRRGEGTHIPTGEKFLVWWERNEGVPEQSDYAWSPKDENDLLGWPGFGVAVEPAKERGWRWKLIQFANGSGFWQAILSGPQFSVHANNADPALAAWAALREALAARE